MFLRAGVSAALIAILLYYARTHHVMDALRNVGPQWVGLSVAVLAIGWLINAVRWKLLLSAAGVEQGVGRLASLYFIGMFFSQMLPTGAGGDVVRMWEVSRRTGKHAAVIVATLQERLMGMGVSMLMALSVLPLYRTRLPAKVLPLFTGLPILAVLAVSVLIYPRLFLRAGRRLRLPAKWGTLPMVRHIAVELRKAAELPPLSIGRLGPIALVTLIGDLFSMGAWWVLGRGVGIDLPLVAYYLIIPMIWVISMAPSIGGVGVREAGFVSMMTLFAVPADKSLAVAALYLLVQLLLAGVGGLLLLGRVWSGTWKREPSSSDLGAT